MSTLVIYAHPNPKSFNHAIKLEVEAALKKQGKEFMTRDLYELNFQPVLQGSDFAAFSAKKPTADIAREQEFIRNADTLVFIHPVWWFGMPAILKGYIDRVFSAGFAYSYTSKGPEGLLKGKRVIIINTTGGDEKTYNEGGFKEALKKTHELGIHNFCGLTVAEHKYFHAVPMSKPETRAKMLEEVKQMMF